MTNDKDDKYDIAGDSSAVSSEQFEAEYEHFKRALPIVQNSLWYNGDTRDLMAARCLCMAKCFLDDTFDDHDAWANFLGDLDFLCRDDVRPDLKDLNNTLSVISNAIDSHYARPVSHTVPFAIVGEAARQPVRVTVTTTEFEAPLSDQEDRQSAAELIRAARTNEKPAAPL